MKKITSFSLFLCLLILTKVSFAASTLDTVKKRGHLKCGVNKGLTGFANIDSQGKWSGLDVDVCRAIAAAIFGDDTKVKYLPLNAQQRFTALQSGEVDVLPRNTTVTLSRDTSLGLNFGPVNYYDGQGFMVPKSLGIKSAKELGGASLCVQSGTTTEKNLADYFRANKMQFKSIAMEDFNTLKVAFFSGRCDAYTTDKSGLAVIRSEAKDPSQYVILPENISKEPLAPAVRHGDDQWLDILTWSMHAMVNAEEFGVTSKNVDRFLESDDPKIKRLLGVIPDAGPALGLDAKWAYNIVKLVGNYGESFERNLGTKTQMGLERGLNELWNKGGIMYAAPIR